MNAFRVTIIWWTQAQNNCLASTESLSLYIFHLLKKLFLEKWRRLQAKPGLHTVLEAYNILTKASYSTLVSTLVFLFLSFLLQVGENISEYKLGGCV
jgi:hypothetical protein